MLLLSLPRLMVTSKLSAETQDFIEFSFFLLRLNKSDFFAKTLKTLQEN